MRLEGKRVLITGTGGGQGKAAQAMFEREGARVIGCDVQPGKADDTVDLTDPDAARRWIDDSAERLGGIDVLYLAVVDGHLPCPKPNRLLVDAKLGVQPTRRTT